MTSTAIAAPRRSNAILWIAAAALALAELAVVSLIAMPRVSPAYSAYYMRQSTSCYLPDGVPVIELGRTVGATGRVALSRCITDAGWLKPRQFGTILRGNTGSLSFRLAEAPVGDVRFSFVAFATGRQPPPAIALLVNGQSVGTVRLSRDAHGVQSVVIPRAALAGDRVVITFALHADGRPWARRLSLLRWRLDPVDAPSLTAMAPPGYY